MRCIPTFLLVTSLALLGAACSGAPTAQPAAPEGTPKSVEPAATGDETCPPKDATTNPPTCPEGCSWDGQSCKRQRGVIVDEEPPPPPPP
jgi:hypothetical protein